MYEALRKVLGNEQIDFAMSAKTSALIELWSRMYEEKAPWLHNTDNANIPATIAGEIARLTRLTTLELQSKVEGSPRAECMDAVYQQVLGKLRVQTEYAFAKGSMVFKPYITPDGTIAVQYIQADMFFPLDFDSEKMTRCAFLDQFRKGNEIYSRIELYSLSGDVLSIKNHVFIGRREYWGRRFRSARCQDGRNWQKKCSFQGSRNFRSGILPYRLEITEIPAVLWACRCIRGRSSR